KSGAYLLKIITNKTQALCKQGLDVKLWWVPAYIGIWGNKVVDAIAKEAIG
ncbi:hypothetical protein LY78DRAFT_594985, partial [Colletotrichum sublineola]